MTHRYPLNTLIQTQNTHNKTIAMFVLFNVFSGRFFVSMRWFSASCANKIRNWRAKRLFLEMNNSNWIETIHYVEEVYWIRQDASGKVFREIETKMFSGFMRRASNFRFLNKTNLFVSKCGDFRMHLLQNNCFLSANFSSSHKAKLYRRVIREKIVQLHQKLTQTTCRLHMYKKHCFVAMKSFSSLFSVCSHIHFKRFETIV